MAIIPLPNAIRFARQIEWSLDRPAQINRSGYTGQRQVTVNPWHGKWTAKAELAPIVGEANMCQWRAFLASLRGAVNSFRLPATETAQNRNSGVTLFGAQASGDTAFLLQGLSEALKIGQFITVNDQLLLLVNVGALSGSTQGVTVEPPLRVAAIAGTGVITRRPTALVALKDSAVGWSVGVGQVYGASLDVEEVYSPAVIGVSELSETAIPGRGTADAGAIVLGKGRSSLLASGSIAGMAAVLGRSTSVTSGAGVGSAVGTSIATGVGSGGAVAGTSRSASTVARTSANTIPPSPTFSFTRPLDWANGDSILARWSSSESMASPTEGPVLTLATSTTSYDLINPDQTSGPLYIEIAVWNGTRPGTLTWSNRIGAGDTATPSITSTNSAGGLQNLPTTKTVTATKGGYLQIVGGLASPYASVLNNQLVLEALAATGTYPVDVQWVSYAGVPSATQTITFTIAVNTPSQFTFTDVANTGYSTVYTSNTITIAGLAAGTSVACSVASGTYSKNGGAYTSADGAVQNGDTITLRGTSPSADNGRTDVQFTAGTTTDFYSLSTPGFTAILSLGQGLNDTDGSGPFLAAGIDRNRYIDSTDGIIATMNNQPGACSIVKSPFAMPNQWHVEVTLLAVPVGSTNFYFGIVDRDDAVGPNVSAIPGNGALSGFTLPIYLAGTSFFPRWNGTNSETWSTATNTALNDVFVIEGDNTTHVIKVWHVPGGTGTPTLMGTAALTSAIPANPRFFVGAQNTGDSISFNGGHAGAFVKTPTAGYTGY